MEISYSSESPGKVRYEPLVIAVYQGPRFAVAGIRYCSTVISLYSKMPAKPQHLHGSDSETHLGALRSIAAKPRKPPLRANQSQKKKKAKVVEINGFGKPRAVGGIPATWKFLKTRCELHFPKPVSKEIISLARWKHGRGILDILHLFFTVLGLGGMQMKTSLWQKMKFGMTLSEHKKETIRTLDMEVASQPHRSQNVSQDTLSCISSQHAHSHSASQPTHSHSASHPSQQHGASHPSLSHESSQPAPPGSVSQPYQTRTTLRPQPQPAQAQPVQLQRAQPQPIQPQKDDNFEFTLDRL